jgi:hypothetical protein
MGVERPYLQVKSNRSTYFPTLANSQVLAWNGGYSHEIHRLTCDINLRSAASLDARRIVAEGIREMLLSGGSNRKGGLQGLGNPEEIALFVQQQDALVAQARREEVQQHVRHLKFDLAQRIVFLVLTVAIGIALIIGALGDPELLRVALGGGSVGAFAGGLYRWGAKQRARPG